MATVRVCRPPQTSSIGVAIFLSRRMTEINDEKLHREESREHRWTCDFIPFVGHTPYARNTRFTRRPPPRPNVAAPVHDSPGWSRVTPRGLFNFVTCWAIRPGYRH